MQTQERSSNRKTGLIIAAIVIGAGILGFVLFDADVEGEVEVPEVEVLTYGGELPDVEVEGPDVDVGSQTAEVRVPEVDVDTRTAQVELPEVDVELPED